VTLLELFGLANIDYQRGRAQMGEGIFKGNLAYVGFCFKH